MDGPNINWEVLGKLDDKLISDNFVRTLHIGSCAEHIIHGFLKDGIDKSEWIFDKLLKAMFWLFNESPARCDVYRFEGNTDKFLSGLFKFKVFVH